MTEAEIYVMLTSAFHDVFEDEDIAHHCAQYIDVLPQMSKVERPADMYYLVNGHPNAKGHAVIANAVISGLLNNAAFSSCEPPRQSEKRVN